MVLSQPHLALTAREPFRCTEEAKSRQLNAIAAALQVARDATHGATKTHFTLFPEYSIPAPEGITLIEDTLRRDDWPSQSIVIGGTDGLSSAQYATLAATENTHFDTTYNDPERVPAGRWINCGIIWVKTEAGTIERWLQPKLRPSWPEQNVRNSTMFQGNSVFIFKGNYETVGQYRFGVLVCYDWIATVEDQKPWRAMIETLSRHATSMGAELSLSWLFVIQHNRSPSDESFLLEVNDFFDQTVAENVRRERACLVFVNSAGRAEPGRIEAYGNTSLIFAGQTLFTMPMCHATFRTGGARSPSRRLIRNQKDFLLREGGACIHSFEQVNPNSLVSGAARRTIALQNPFVYPANGVFDPRTPADVVPAAVKWLNDELDTIRSLAQTYATAPLVNDVDMAHDRAIGGLRNIGAEAVDQTVRLASPSAGVGQSASTPPEGRSADDWGQLERSSVVHLVHTVSLLDVCSDGCTVSDAPAHATLSFGDRELDVVAIRGETHDACRKYYTELLPAGRRPVLLVSRDEDNNDWLERFGSYIEPLSGRQYSERNFTDAQGVWCQVGYRSLLAIFQEAGTVEEAKERFSDKLTH